MAKKLFNAIMYSVASNMFVASKNKLGEDYNRVTVMGIGERSVGKTATVRAAAKQIAQKMGLKFNETSCPRNDEFG